MNIVCHPGYKTDSVFSWICDNYIVGENGVYKLKVIKKDDIKH